MSGLKSQIVTWSLTLTFPVVILLGIYFFFTTRFDHSDLGRVKIDVGENSRKIRSNATGVERNEAGIAENSQRLDAAEEAIGENQEKIEASSKKIGENEKEIKTQREAMDALRKELSSKIGALEKEMAGLKTVQEEELEFRKETLKRIEALNEQIRRLAKKLIDHETNTAKRLEGLEKKGEDAKE